MIRFAALVTFFPVLAGAAPAYPKRAHVPLFFERNLGQSPPTALFLARTKHYTLELTTNALRIRIPGPAQNLAAIIYFDGALQSSTIEPLDQLSTQVNYYRGDPRTWLTGVPCWSRVRVRNIYTGIDLVFHGNDDALEFDFELAAGADPAQVKMKVDGSIASTLERDGSLLLVQPGVQILLHKPRAYQTDSGLLKPIAAQFEMRGRTVTFHVDKRDRHLPLVIDPVVSVSTFLGGSQNDGARAVAVDSSGNMLITGNTVSGNLPVDSATYQADFRGSADGGPGDVFLAKLDPTGSHLVYITYLGGSNAEVGTALAVDTNGNAIVAGSTSSTDFPVTNGSKFSGGGDDNGLNPLIENFPGDGDIFIAKFDPAGKLLWSTYLGGSESDLATALAIDKSGNIFLAGDTLSSGFPVTAGAYQTKFGGAGGQPTIADTGYVSVKLGDAFVAKIDPQDAHILAATFLGGSVDDVAMALAVDSSGNVWVGGATLSTNFPTTHGSFQTAFGGASNFNTQFIGRMGDGFIAQFSPDLRSLLYSTYLGGSQDDAVVSIAVDSSGMVYAAGVTQSPNFPAAKTLYPFKGPSQHVGQRPYLLGDAFVTKLNPSTNQLVFSTYLGGSDDDIASSIAVDSQGSIIVAGMTNSADYPVSADAQQPKFGGSGSSLFTGVGDGFVAAIDPVTPKLLYSSFIGGSSDDAVTGMTIANGAVYLAGYTNSLDFKTTSAGLQPATAGRRDAFLVRITGLAASSGPSIAAVTNAASFVRGVAVPGSIASLFGTNLTNASGINLAGSLPLPPSFQNVSVLVNDQPAPIFAVDNVNGQQQINIQVPWEIAGKSSARFQVQNNGVAGPSLTVAVAAAQPGIFTYGQGFGAILHANFQPADIAHPAKAGETVLIYATGLGAVSSHPASGAPATGAASTSATATVTIGSANAPVSYSGLSPGFVGLYQVNAKVPSGLKSGNQPVIVSISGAGSNSALLPVQ